MDPYKLLAEIQESVAKLARFTEIQNGWDIVEFITDVDEIVDDLRDLRDWVNRKGFVPYVIKTD